MGKKIIIATLMMVLMLGGFALAQASTAEHNCSDCTKSEKGAKTCSDAKSADKCQCNTHGKNCTCPPGKCTCKDSVAGKHEKCGPGGCNHNAMQPGKHGHYMGTGQRRMNMRRHRGMGHSLMGSFLLRPDIREKLALTEKQADALEQLKARQMKEAIDMMADIQKKNVDVRLMMKSLDPDMAALEAKMKEIALQKVQLKLHRIKGFQQAKALLTDKQKATLKELWNKPPMPFRAPAPPPGTKGGSLDGPDCLSMLSPEDIELINLFEIDSYEIPDGPVQQ